MFVLLGLSLLFSTIILCKYLLQYIGTMRGCDRRSSSLFGSTVLGQNDLHQTVVVATENWREAERRARTSCCSVLCKLSRLPTVNALLNFSVKLYRCTQWLEEGTSR